MMDSKTYALIRMTMVDYIKKGTKSSYKKVQMKKSKIFPDVGGWQTADSDSKK